MSHPHPTELTAADGQRLFDAVLNSWDRSNLVLIQLVRAVPPGRLGARAMPDSPTIAQMVTHMHHERMISVFENAPEFAGPVPEQEWRQELDPHHLAALLIDSGLCVRNAVKGRVEARQGLDRAFAHPIQLLQFLIFHEGYHHGQVKLALKAAGCPLTDAEAGPLTWDVWRAR